MAGAKSNVEVWAARLGVFLLTGVVGVLAYQSFRYVDSKQESKRKPDPVIQAGSNNSFSLPLSVPAGKSIRLVTFTEGRTVSSPLIRGYDDKVFRWPTSQPILPIESVPAYLISNHDSVRVFNLRVPFKIDFDSWEGGKDGGVVLSLTQEVVIDSLAPGETFSIYAVNQSKYLIRMPLPTEATLQIEGETEKRNIKIVAHGEFSDIPDFKGTENIVMPIMPSSHAWSGNAIILPEDKIKSTKHFCFIPTILRKQFISDMKQQGVGGAEVKVWWASGGGEEARRCAREMVDLFRDIDWKPSNDSPAELHAQRDGMIVRTTARYETLGSILRKNLKDAGINTKKLDVGSSDLGYGIEFVVGEPE